MSWDRTAFIDRHHTLDEGLLSRLVVLAERVAMDGVAPEVVEWELRQIVLAGDMIRKRADLRSLDIGQRRGVAWGIAHSLQEQLLEDSA